MLSICFLTDFRLSDLALSTLCAQDQATKSFTFTSINSLPCGCHVKKPTTVMKPVGRFPLSHLSTFLKCHVLV